MKTLGQVLKSYREKKRLSLETLSARTSVQVAYIEALENDARSSLPAFPLVQGYIQLLARELDMSQETAAALFRRDFSSQQKTNLPLRSKNVAWKNTKDLFFTPRFFSLTVLAGALFLGSIFALWQWNVLSQPPKLEVTKPQSFDQVMGAVEVVGDTDTKNTVTINTEVVSLDPDGNFRTSLSLPPGERTIVITATDSRGRSTDHVVFVTVQ